MLFATNDMDYRSKWTSLNDNHNPINLLHSKYILKNTDLSPKNIVAVHSSIRSEEKIHTKRIKLNQIDQTQELKSKAASHERPRSILK